MFILITGATGYIGSVLTARLVKAGHHLKILCRDIPHHELFKSPNITCVRGDINDEGSLSHAMEGCSKVYHLAAFARTWAKDRNIFMRINVDGTRKVMESALRHGIDKVVYASTAGVIGPSIKSSMTEDIERNIAFFNCYEETKSIAENVVLEYVARGLNVTIVNPARVYGPGPDTPSNPVTKIIRLYLKRKWYFIPGSGEEKGSYCYIDDVVDGIIAAMDKGRIGERYILGGENASFNALITNIRMHSKLNYQLFHLPFSFLRFAAQLFTAWANVSGRPPIITPDWLRKYDYNWELNSEKAIRELGYRIRPLQDGVKETIKWLEKNKT